MTSLFHRLDSILLLFRPAFSRQASFRWFVLLIWGILLAERSPAITSYLNAINLPSLHYYSALHWFHSSAYSLHHLWQIWATFLQAHPYAHRLHDHLVYVADSIKVSKEGRRMPAVKKLHQSSQNINKPQWIYGHYYGVLSLLMSRGSALWTTLIAGKLQDGWQPDSQEKSTTVDKMIELCIQIMDPGSYVILDAYYGAKKRWNASAVKVYA